MRGGGEKIGILTCKVSCNFSLCIQIQDLLILIVERKNGHQKGKKIKKSHIFEIYRTWKFGKPSRGSNKKRTE
jgi:hypothetical protein